MAKISRAEFLLLIGSAAPGLAISRRLSAAGQAPAGDRNAEMRARIATLIETYDSQGIHRTATPVDNASADWLRRIATVAGGEARMVPFTLQQVDVRAAYLEVDGKRIEGLPLFDGGFTGETGIVGPLGPAGSNADIVLVTFDQAAISSEGRAIADLRRGGGPHRAIVAITNGGTPGLSPSNAVAFATPYGLPVLQVGSDNQPLLSDLAAKGRPVRLVAAATKSSSEAMNVVATLAGRQPSLAPLVVMTPRSGWWQCAAERGGGLACWVEALRAVHAATAARPAIFVASSGHELGHYGLDAFLHERPALIKDAAAWIHLGANIGAAGGQMRLQSSDDEIEKKASDALERHNSPIRQRVPRGTVPGGEARNIHVGGGRYASLLGSSVVFHNQKDRWPNAVDLDLVTRYARAVADLAVGLAAAPTAG